MKEVCSKDERSILYVSGHALYVTGSYIRSTQFFETASHVITKMEICTLRIFIIVRSSNNVLREAPERNRGNCNLFGGYAQTFG